MRRINLDLDVIRTFVTGIELGSFAKAAVRLGRSTSAVSAQLKKLEEQVGTPILHKQGRGLALTTAGETMLSYGRRLLDLNDEAAAAVGSLDLDGCVRLGVQEDLGETVLPHVLGRFARAHPKIRMEARIMRNVDLLGQVGAGQLDLALAWNGEGDGVGGEAVARFPMRWIGRWGQDGIAPTGPIPLVLFEPPCLFRTAALAALDAAGLSWRVALTGSSLHALWAAASAGICVTLRTELGLPTGVALTPEADGLPNGLPCVSLVLHRGGETLGPAAERLVEIIRATVKEGSASLRQSPGQ